MSHIEKRSHIYVSINDLTTRTGEDYFLISKELGERLDSADSVIFDGFIICIFTGAELALRINGKQYRPRKGDVLVLAPNMILEYEDAQRAKDALKIITTIDLVMELPSPFDTDFIAAARRFPLIRPEESELEWIVQVYSLIARIHSDKDGYYRKEILKSLTFGILYKLGEVYQRLDEQMPEASRLNDERLSDEFFRLLAKHFRTSRTVKFYADRMALTPKYLSMAIRRITGKSIHEWVDDAIILEIKNLLKTTDLTVLQISEELNFCSASALVQFFRKHTGVTPRHYRLA
ncbi:MAG: helix-turn-helix domain-containing protein [Candidatus Cryptobacteroides sp.]